MKVGILITRRKDGTAVKIDETWVQLIGGAQKFAERIPFGTKVEYAEDGSYIKEIGETEAKAPIQDNIASYKPQPKKELDSIPARMAECLIEAENIYQNETLSSEFKKNLDFTKIAITMFLSRERKDEKQGVK